MRYDLHLRQEMKTKLESVVRELKDWNYETNVYEEDIKKLLSNYMTYFEHCKYPDHSFSMGGSDSSGDFPVVTYGDSFVYLVTATTRVYEALSEGRMKEKELPINALLEFLWLPEDNDLKNEKFIKFFKDISGDDLAEVISKSGYLDLKRKATNKTYTANELVNKLIFPAAHDAANVRVQIMVAFELCSVISLLKSGVCPTYILTDNTLTLPFIKSDEGLFFEVLKRYCCKMATEKGIGFFAVSKSHNLPHMEKIEAEILNNGSNEHWFFRIPNHEEDEWEPEFLGKRSIPPIGAITYIFRLHKTTPPLRLDMDKAYWNEYIKHDNKQTMKNNEIQLFRDLDFASHDQRCFGYPYPIKASHDIVSLTKAEREAFRKQVIDAAERIGLSRRNFIDASLQTGHR
ncbi:hypothetical protein YDYSG_27450 [Paenibacillus tyrfis]|uniref:hypothetical protein n=1 Tax=Paenibacillus tyrfis TaxID=1501230 RepID=UPI002491C8AD|nr:hypothetical protein [Paenibacillus tyrfis]GLI06715.1 hypothetical protein YDYSG_27450 [Paenibacillus tyrfis]